MDNKKEEENISDQALDDIIKRQEYLRDAFKEFEKQNEGAPGVDIILSFIFHQLAVEHVWKEKLKEVIFSYLKQIERAVEKKG